MFLKRDSATGPIGPVRPAALPERAGLRAGLALLGPAFVSGIAYVDPGNVATNTTAGAKYGYLLVWVVVTANVLAILVQYLSAKLGLATGRSLAAVCRDELPRPVSRGLWIQAECVAIATDLAEIVGGALALYILFDLPLLVGGLITGFVSYGLLLLQQLRRQGWFERAICYLLGVIVLGFGWSAVAAKPDPVALGGGLIPGFEGTDSLLVATGILGATVMPHAIYLHSALVADRFGKRRLTADRRQRLLRGTRTDVLLAMLVAGAVNLAMLVLAAAALHGSGAESIEEVHAGLGQVLGPLAALLFALALLASGFASTAVGTVAGSVILDGFLRRRIPLVVRRGVTLVPALLILAMGVDPTTALVLSQVILSFGIPFALIPLVRFTASRRLMGELVNRPITTVAAAAVAALVSGLNIVLLALTFGVLG